MTHTTILAYASDITSLDTVLFSHSRSVFDLDMQVASIDHSIWLHRSVRIDDWLLFVRDSPIASASLGLARRHFFARDGSMIAIVAR